MHFFAWQGDEWVYFGLVEPTEAANFAQMLGVEDYSTLGW